MKVETEVAVRLARLGLNAFQIEDLVRVSRRAQTLNVRLCNERIDMDDWETKRSRLLAKAQAVVREAATARVKAVKLQGDPRGCAMRLVLKKNGAGITEEVSVF